MLFLTDFGDAMVLVPVAAAMLVWLVGIAGLRTAGLWAAALLLCGACTALLKIYFGACPAAVDAIASPSGHASMSTLVYGSLAFIVGIEAAPWQRLAAGAAGTGVVVGIALTRVLAGAHSPAEVMLGLAIGGIALAAFARIYREARPVARRIGPLVAAVAIVALLLHGHAAHLEPLWRGAAAWLHDDAGLCRA